MSQGRASLRFLVRLRWALLAVSPFMFGLSAIGSSGSTMWWVMAVFGASNVLLQMRARNQHLSRSRWTWYPVFLCDLLLVTWVVYVRGGIRTDTYLVYMLVACQAGILLQRWEAWVVGLASLAAYAGAVLAVDGPQEMDRVAIRTVYLALAGVTTTYLAAAERRAVHASLTDAKTNLPNARLFQEALSEWVGVASRQGLPLSVAFMDVDNFRQLNAAIGHPLADRVLEQLADVLTGWKRPDDLIARYGGEEFVFMLPAQTAQGALRRLEALREQIAATEFHVGGAQPVRITISIGITSLAGSPTVTELLINADRALLKAKAEGKNRLVCA
ncbi:MAG TPA: GGDEF domain-containing protein [Symbiobacteriaceae bacterium]|nr:GGDEF domain-containing protein [Symbiobacteriaceae bacterium]